MKIDAFSVCRCDLGSIEEALKANRHTYAGIRLCLVYIPDRGNGRMTIAPITGKKIDRIYSNELFLPKGTGSLRYNSKLILDLETVHVTALIGRPFGTLDAYWKNQIESKIRELQNSACGK